MLAAEFPDSSHVTSLGLDTGTDRDIWGYARDRGLVIVSKDSDFRQLAFLHGPPPKIIWLRLGNASTVDILNVVLEYVDDIAQFGASSDEALLILPRPTA